LWLNEATKLRHESQGGQMASFLIAGAFILMILAPCMVAMGTGLHEGADHADRLDPEDLEELAASRARVPE
jgi:hypothetical protein